MAGFVPPPYPYDRLNELKAAAVERFGSVIDLSIGTPCDPPPEMVVAAMARSDAERGYPPSIGTEAFRSAAATWLNELAGTAISSDDVRAAIGTKEFVAGLPHWLKLRTPDKDTVLYPEISYPSYAMGATLGNCRAVPVAVDEQWRIDLTSISDADAERALCLWVNTPGNPAGGLDDLEAVAAWGRRHHVPVFSDECYIEFTWQGSPRSILEHGTHGLVAVHSLSKRSNFAGARAGFYAGDADLIHYLSELRKHAGFMPPGPVQAASVVAFGDAEHVAIQRERYDRRLRLMALVLEQMGIHAQHPGGGFYLWVPAPDGDAWGLTRRLANELGVLITPGEFFGPAGQGHVRIAVVQPDDQISLIAERAGRAEGVPK